MPDYVNDWYYMEPDFRGELFVRGPVSLEQMRALFDEGRIHLKTQVRCGSDSFWHPVEDVMPLLAGGGQKGRGKGVGSATWRKMLLFGFAIIVSLIALRLGISLKSFGPTVLHHQNQFTGEPLEKETLIKLTNEARSDNGFSVLTENGLLNAVAEERARDMLDKQYFAHVSPTGEGASEVAQKTGYRYKIIAENIAKGSFLTNQKLIDGWMQSPGHRKNILSPEVREIGVSILKGTYQGEETWVGVQIFGLQSPPVSDKSCTPPPSDLANQISAKKSEIQALNERIINLRQELEHENTSLGMERIAAGRDYKRNYDLNGRISAHNERIDWHNQLAAELREKGTSLNSMVDDYNRMVQDYRNCQNSH